MKSDAVVYKKQTDISIEQHSAKTSSKVDGIFESLFDNSEVIAALPRAVI
jgi:hypothetical protein